MNFEASMLVYLFLLCIRVLATHFLVLNLGVFFVTPSNAQYGLQPYTVMFVGMHKLLPQHKWAQGLTVGSPASAKGRCGQSST